MTLIYRNTHWLVVNKPSGISTHRAHTGDIGLVEWLDLHQSLQVRVCSRLDKETSGVLVFALTPEAVAKAQTFHEQKLAQKEYYFIAQKSSKSSWNCKRALDGKPCKTTFKKIREGTRYAMYRATIYRGRTHQIRRHAAASGVPILGDTQYQGAPFVRLCLHCRTVRWPEIEQVLQVNIPRWFEPLTNGIIDKLRILALAEKRYPFLSAISDCCRLIHRGEFSKENIAVDKYGDWLCVTGFDETLPAKQLLMRLGSVLPALTKGCKCRGGVVKTNLHDPHRRKLFADFATWGEEIPESFLASEHDLFFNLSLNDNQHVGLFLDQRDSRRRIAKIAHHQRVANLFAFTCSFSIFALAASAEVVFSVDLAAGCLKRGKENAAINQLAEGKNAKFIQEDVRKWLARQIRKKQNHPDSFIPFGVIICDPPVFASSGKGKNFHVEKEWPALARDVYTILSKNGIALFSNNHQAGSESFYFKTLTQHFSSVTRLNPPLDFPQVSGIPSHVRIYWCQK